MKETILNKIYLPKTIKELNKKIELLDLKNYDIYSFLNKRLIGCIIIFLVILLFIPYGFILGPIATIVYYYLTSYICFDYPLKIRVQNLNNNAIYFLEILILSLDSETSLINAIKKSSEVLDNDLSLEFQKVVKEVELGKDLTQSLKDMQKRMPSAMIKTIILNLINAYNLGSDIKTSLINELDYLKEQELLNSKERLTILPMFVKIMSFLFIILVSALIIIPPILIRMIQ